MLTEEKKQAVICLSRSYSLFVELESLEAFDILRFSKIERRERIQITKYLITVDLVNRLTLSWAAIG